MHNSAEHMFENKPELTTTTIFQKVDDVVLCHLFWEKQYIFFIKDSRF